MNIWDAIGLGALQGLTEFLPVSSSGHLTLFRVAELPDQTAWTVLLHLASALAIVMFLWRDWKQLPFSRQAQKAEGAGAETEVFRPFLARWAQFLILCTIPAALAYFVLHRPIEQMQEMPLVAAGALLVNGTLLFLVDWHKLGGDWRLHRIAPLSPQGLKVLAIGVAQAIALVPGLSRSGMTISCGLWAGLERPEAVRFSFCLGLIAILGATVVKAKDFTRLFDQLGADVIIAGFVSSFLVSLASLWMLLAIVRGMRLRWFGVYCWIAGAAGLVVHLANPAA